MRRSILSCGFLACVAGPSLAQSPEAVNNPHVLTVDNRSLTRSEACLNGLWRFQPAVSRNPDPGSWGKILVPGTWCDTPGRIIRSNVIETGQGAAWEIPSEPGQANTYEEVHRAWYQISVEIPATWQKQRIFLDLQRLSTDAAVTINGRKAGTISFPEERLEITEFLTPGRAAEILLEVVASTDSEFLTRYFESADAQVVVEKAKVNARGLLGEVFLRTEPPGATVSDVFVQPSVRKTQVVLDIELSGVPEGTPVDFHATFLNPVTGAVEKEERWTLEKSTQSRIQHVIAWENPRLWDFQAPELYQLHLSAKGQGLEDVYPVQFGFREFWIEGRDFYLNGSKFPLRPTTVSEHPGLNISEQRRQKMSLNFNIEELWPWDHDARGSINFREEIAAKSDEIGWPLIGVALCATKYIGRDASEWAKPGVREKYQQRMEAEMKRYRNHPSILMWATTANFFGNSQDQNPKVIGRRDWIQNDEKWEARRMIGEEVLSLIRQADPTRPVFTHQGAYVGDVYAVNHYLNFIPLQEREEWMSEWSKTGEMPYIGIEFGLPMDLSLRRARKGHKSADRSEPLLTEFAAIYLGDKAYDLEREEYRTGISAALRAGNVYRFRAPTLWNEPAYNEILKIFIPSTWRSWRMAGVSGGMIPWGFSDAQTPWAISQATEPNKPTPPPFGARGHVAIDSNTKPKPTVLAHEMQKANAPVGAWIGGESKTITDKTHNFEVGTDVHKTLCLSNASRNSATYSITWKATLGNKEIASGELNAVLKPGDNKVEPIAFTLPTGDHHGPGEILLTGTSDEAMFEDRFAFTVYPKTRDPELNTPLEIFDPEGSTTKTLNSLGYKLIEWDGEIPPSKLVILGRNSLEKDKPRSGSLAKVLEAGGTVLMMGHSPEFLRDKLGFRISRHVSRRFWMVPNQTFLQNTEKFDKKALRDWSGEGSLVEGYPDYINQPFESGVFSAFPYAGWRWGNRGSVSSAAIEKPHFSAMRPVLEGEFDLAFSPLLELPVGNGRLILCTLDFEDRGRTLDPAAQSLLNEMIDSILSEKSSLPKAQPTFYIGDTDNEKLLRSMGLVFEKATTVPKAPALLIVGTGSRPDEESVRAFLEQGGQVVVLPLASGEKFMGIQAGSARPFFGVKSLPMWPEIAGLSRSDIRLRVDQPVVRLETPESSSSNWDGILVRQNIGKGFILFCQLTPAALDTKAKPYLRFSQWRLHRMLSQILGNSGGVFESDTLLVKLLQGDAEEAPSWYLNNYITDFEFGDDYTRYYRW